MGIFVSRKNILRCPKCGGTYFRDDGFKLCIHDGCSLITEDEYQSHDHTPKIECPYCHSTNTKKISTFGRVFSTEFLGLGSSKVGKQWHCNKCNSDF